jgi:hypothetical protein
MKYRIYVDEVGNPDLESSDNPNHRFLSLTGIIVSLDHIENVVHPQMEVLKTTYFHSHPDEPVIFHRKEMLTGKPPFESLTDPETRKRFDDELIALLGEWEYTVVTVCLDKKKHKESYSIWRYDPYHYCLAILIERFVFFLNRRQASGDVMGESRGGKEDMRLKASFERLWVHGSEYVGPEQFQTVLTSKQLKVKPKSLNIAGLQLAEHDLLGKPIAPFSKRVIAVLQEKYYQREGRVFGKKLL